MVSNVNFEQVNVEYYWNTSAYKNVVIFVKSYGVSKSQG